MRDAIGFDQFYRDTRQRVLRYLLGVSGGDLAEAQDAAAEAYARAWQRWDTVSACDDPEAWVRVVAWRILASGWRKLRGRRAAYTRHGPAPAPTEPGVEGVALPVHWGTIVALGVPILDNCDLEAVGKAAAARRRWAFLLTVAPLAVEGGTGSPVNPLATF